MREPHLPGPCAGLSKRRELRELFFRQRELRRPDKALELLKARRARDRRRHTGARVEPSDRDLGGRRLMLRRHLIERAQDREAALIQIAMHAASARALPEIGLASVFPREEAARERKIGDDSELLFDRELRERALE